MKTRIILIPILVLSIVSSSFKQPGRLNENLQARQTVKTEGLFGEDDCAPGVIYSFIVNGKELEYQSPYVFYFCPDGTLTAVGREGMIPGKWSIDNLSGTVNIDINGEHEIFKLVSGNWTIMEHTETALELESYENGYYRKVRFERMKR